MTKEQFLEKYGKPNTVVHCKTKELAEKFLNLCEESGIRWRNGDNALSNLNFYWEAFTDRVCYNLNGGEYLLCDEIEYYKKNWYTVIPFEPEQKTRYPVEKILEMLPVNVKVNEDFLVRGFGDELFYFDKRLKLCCINPQLKYDIYIGDFISGKYIIEKLPLLTEEEKAFLKCFEFEKMWNEESHLMFDVTRRGHRVLMLDFIEHKFDGLELGRKYTRGELGL